MDYRACFTCELLYEVTGDGEALCPKCGSLLEFYEPSEVYSLDESAPAHEEPMDERTRVVSRLDPALLEGIPDPELSPRSHNAPPIEEMTKISPSGFAEQDAAARGRDYGPRGRRAADYRAAEVEPEIGERRVPLGRAVQSVGQEMPPDDGPPRITGEHRRPERSYEPAQSTPTFRAPSEMGTGKRGVSYRATQGRSSVDVSAANPDGVTAVEDARAKKPATGGTREFAEVRPVSQRPQEAGAEADTGQQDGFTPGYGRDGHGGRRSIHRRKSANEQRQGPVAVDIPLPSFTGAQSLPGMERTRMLDVGNQVLEKTEVVLQSELDDAVDAQRAMGGVPATEDDDHARTRVVRRSEEFDELLQRRASVDLAPTGRVVAGVVAPTPEAVPSSQGTVEPTGPGRGGPDPRPRRLTRSERSDAPVAVVGEPRAGPSPAPRSSPGPSPTPKGRPSPSPRPAESAPIASRPSGGATPVAVSARGSHADYFETGIDEDVDLTDAIDAIVGDQLIQNLESKRSTLSREKRASRRARARWLLVALPVVAVCLLLLILVPKGDGPADRAADAAVVDDVAPKRTVLNAIGRVGLELPRIRGTQSLDERAPYLVASAEAMRTSFGPVLGLTSNRIPEPLLKGDPGENWIKPLHAALKENTPPNRDVFLIGLDAGATAETVALIGRSATRAGFERLALTFDRQEAGGGVGMLGFRLGKGKLPSAGGALIRIGSLSVHTRIESRDGRRLSEEMMEVSNADDGNFDLEAIDARLERLSRAHPLVRVGVIYANRELPLGDLAAVMQRVTVGPEKERFTSLRLVVR